MPQKYPPAGPDHIDRKKALTSSEFQVPHWQRPWWLARQSLAPGRAAGPAPLTAVRSPDVALSLLLTAQPLLPDHWHAELAWPGPAAAEQPDSEAQRD
jgi:hypothetical protein